MPTFHITLLLALLVAAAPASAQDDALYRALGSKADARIGHFFKDSNPRHLADQLTDQVCQASGGPCVYDGPTMKESHAELQIRRADFNRLVELLQDTLQAQGVPFGVQNRLLARLAPMHRDIIDRGAGN